MDLYRYTTSPILKEKIILETYTIIKDTPCGYQIVLDYFSGGMQHESKFMYKAAYKRYAWATKEEALRSFIKRKEKYLRIIRAKESTVWNNLIEAKKMLENQQNLIIVDFK